jgi:hypothetical protein
MSRVADDLAALEALVESRIATHLSEDRAAEEGDHRRREALDDLGLEQARYELRVIRALREARQSVAARALLHEPTMAHVKQAAAAGAW